MWRFLQIAQKHKVPVLEFMKDAICGKVSVEGARTPPSNSLLVQMRSDYAHKYARDWAKLQGLMQQIWDPSIALFTITSSNAEFKHQIDVALKSCPSPTAENLG